MVSTPPDFCLQVRVDILLNSTPWHIRVKIAGRQQAASGSTKVLHMYKVADNMRMQIADRKARGLKEDYDSLQQAVVAGVEMSGFVDPEDIGKPETMVCWSILSCPTVHREGSRREPPYMCPPALPALPVILVYSTGGCLEGVERPPHMGLHGW